MDYKIIIILMVAVILVASCRTSQFGNPERKRTLNEAVVVNRMFTDEYELYFNKDHVLDFTKNHNFDLYMSHNPDSLFLNEPTLSVNTDTLRIRGGIEPTERMYFGIRDKERKDTFYHIASERLIPLEGQVNCRDLGGIETKDGRVTKWGKIYRSGQLSELTDRDVAYLESLNIKTVLDFRNDIEIEKQPDRLPKQTQYVRSPIADKEGEHYRSLKKQLIFHKIRSSNAKSKFTEIMQAFVDTAAVDFKPVMNHLKEREKTPLLFHCAGGKDRTGAMASIILLTLGVDEAKVKQEYLMSNYYRYFFNKEKMKSGRKMLLGKGTLENAFIVQEEYIDAVFEIINVKYGGIENYIQEKFDINPEERRWLIQEYTYDPRILEFKAEEL